MKRTKTRRQVDLILTSDWHLREDVPVCRVDDFEETQWRKVQFIAGLQKKYGCPVFHGGDLFHHWKPSPRLLTLTMRHLPEQFYTIYGQHDLPQHNMDLAEKCGINTLVESGHVKLLDSAHWGVDPNEVEPIEIKGRKILVWHHLTYTRAPFPGASGGMAEGILKKYPQFDLILTGDNHQQFTTQREGRILVNPGSLMRQSAGQIDFQPRCYLWNASSNQIKAIDIPIKKDAITRDHIEKKEERDSRIEAFVERLDTEWEAVLDFQENLKRIGHENKIDKQVMEIAYKALEA